eukprot:IDg13340t1
MGRGVEKNNKKAFDLLLQAANAGNASGKALVGIAYNDGYLVERDREKACEFVQSSLEAGLATAVEDANETSLTILGLLYYLGLGVEKNIARSAALLERATAMDDDSAQCLLGILHLHGIAVREDVPKAVALFRSAVRKKK